MSCQSTKRYTREKRNLFYLEIPVRRYTYAMQRDGAFRLPSTHRFLPGTRPCTPAARSTHSPPICAQINLVSSRHVATQQAPAAGRGCVCVLPARAARPVFQGTVCCDCIYWQDEDTARGRQIDEQRAGGLVTCMCIQGASELRVASLVRRVAMQRNAGSATRVSEGAD
jgi:hypothetical protein